MPTQAEGRNLDLGGAIFTIVAATFLGYLALTALQGEYGLFRLLQTESEQAELEERLSALREQRMRISNDARRLSAVSIDLDLLDERAREVLGLGRLDEVIIR